MKKWVLILAGVLMSMGMLVGCSGGEGEPVLDPASTEAPADPTMTTPELDGTETDPDASAPTDGADEAETPAVE